MLPGFSHQTLLVSTALTESRQDAGASHPLFGVDPIIVFAGNERLSDRTALVFEFWKFPEVEIQYSPLFISTRFIGGKFSVDIGAGSSLELLQEGIPIPILNFTYHP